MIDELLPNAIPKAPEVLAAALSTDGARVVWGGGIPFATPKYRKETTHLVVSDASRGGAPVLLRGNTELLDSVAFAPDGRFVVSLDKASGLASWDISRGIKQVGRAAKAFHEISGWAHSVTSRFVKISANGARVVTAGGTKVVCWSSVAKLIRGRVLDVSATACTPACSDPAAIVAFSLAPDGTHAVVAGLAQSLARWDLDDKASAGPTHTAPGMFFSLDWSPDGRRIAALEAYREPAYSVWAGTSVRYPWKGDRYPKRLVVLDASTLTPLVSIDMAGNPQAIAWRGNDSLITAGTEADRVVLRVLSSSDGAQTAAISHGRSLVRRTCGRHDEPFHWVNTLAVAPGIAAVAALDAVRLFRFAD